MYEIKSLQDRKGRYPFDDSLADRIDESHHGYVAKIVNRFSQGNFGDTRHLGSGLMESRRFVRGAGGLRIYYGMDGLTLVLLILCGNKSSQQDDIQRAGRLWQEYLEEKP